MNHHIRHETSLPVADRVNVWRYDAEHREILAAIKCADGPLIHVAIPVRPPSKEKYKEPDRSRYAIHPLNGWADAWEIECGDYHVGLPRMALTLTHAPESVVAELCRTITS